MNRQRIILFGVLIIVLASGMGNIKVICAPVDLRTQVQPMEANHPAWAGELYGQIKSELASLSAPTQ